MSEAIFPRADKTSGDWPSAPLGRVVSVSGGQAVILLDTGPEAPAPERPPAIGTLVAFNGARASVLGQVGAHSTPMPAQNGDETELKLVEVDLVGELARDEDGGPGAFRRGISVHPVLGDTAHALTRSQLASAHSGNGHAVVRIGTLGQDPSIPAVARLGALLERPFAVLGGCGTEASGAAAVILQRLIDTAPGARIVVLDTSGAYAGRFGERAEIVTPEALSLPFWLLAAEELAAVAMSGDGDGRAETDSLRALLPEVRRRRAAADGLAPGGHGIGAETPVPYRFGDLTALIDESADDGDAQVLTRLRARLESVASDPRFAFMFADATEDTAADGLGRLFRMPADGRPLSVVALGGLPEAARDAVVAALARLAPALGQWSGTTLPLLLVCDEAQRFVPREAANDAAPAGRAIARLAADGPAYGVSLALVSRRPGALDPDMLAQCGTVFALRLTGRPEQEALRMRVPEASGGLFGLVATLGEGEAIALGEALALPAHIRFDRPAEDGVRNGADALAERWMAPPAGDDSIAAALRRWRGKG